MKYVFFYTDGAIILKDIENDDAAFQQARLDGDHCVDYTTLDEYAEINEDKYALWPNGDIYNMLDIEEAYDKSDDYEVLSAKELLLREKIIYY